MPRGSWLMKRDSSRLSNESESGCRLCCEIRVISIGGQSLDELHVSEVSGKLGAQGRWFCACVVRSLGGHTFRVLCSWILQVSVRQ